MPLARFVITSRFTCSGTEQERGWWVRQAGGYAGQSGRERRRDDESRRGEGDSVEEEGKRVRTEYRSPINRTQNHHSYHCQFAAVSLFRLAKSNLATTGLSPKEETRQFFMSGGSGDSSPASGRASLSCLSDLKDIELSSESGCLSIVVLGASGDLAKKKTFPALFHLFQQGFLQSGEVHIFGYARSDISDDGLRERIRGYLKGASDEVISEFLQLSMKIQKATNQEARVDYFIWHCLHQSTPSNDGWTRVIVEKPFGKDLDSAEELSAQLGELFNEQQLYRIDHYLGKELVQNLLVLRFANRLFLPLWNRDNIANVQIVFREDFGTEGRGGYFDQYGIIRDIIQNHLLQVFCLVAMEKPVSLKPEHIRDEKVKVLQSVTPINHDEVVLGQYDGYKDDSTVPDDSNTPTFASLVLRVHNERWEGVPFILKAGKALNNRKAEIRVQFKDAPGDIFKCKKQGRNEFVIRLQPSEAMYMKLTVKKPGLEMATEQSELDLSYGLRYQDVKIPEAYERLILDTIRGDQQHFVRRDELRAAWEIFTPLLHDIDAGKLKALPYKPGTRGPSEADELSKRMGYVQTHGYVWIPPTLSKF
uniref:Glucose-6-phosphate 1-dehydrogenase n=1 Tax=Leersia perrieri TaxID=77586 RepID=A0A0D9VHW3_9ORYZ